ncbi:MULTISPECIES: glutathione S-transferase family protein [Roseobacteraceae]|jgi:glutathione S-transferase|uniref:Disulfide-bond oxidoreductase YfcG n=1 Tax=Pseudosulfitobacter pseudonitzschiae TaxID=1402135 RepID=A0A221K2B0_9RHOB|nr:MULTISPECIES: glutathione S-transferase family protein [Roseobacteraceae]ASM73138.1 disulfide-bond oxidoreductase YfcG [Pseudosulfitobacter pseudonitzschiae]
MTMQLHCFGESGNSYKAALPLELSGLDWTPVKVDFFGGATRGQEFRSLNPMGEAPLLIDGDMHISQSGAIQQYITDKTGKFGGTEADKYDVLRWVLFDNHKLSSMAGMTRFLMNFLPEDKRPQVVIDFNLGRLQAAYKTLDDHLATRDWIVGDGVTNADFSCCGYLFYPEPFGFNRKAHDNINRWLANIESLPGWKHPYDLMPGSPADRA